MITDLEFYVQTWNKAAENAYAISASEAIGQHMAALVKFTFFGTTNEQAIVDLRENHVWEGKVSFTNRKGQTFYFLQTVKYILDDRGNAVGILALGHDISARQRAEDQLVKSEQFYRTLIADSLDLTLLLNASGEIIFSTPAIRRILGYTEEEVLQTNAFQYIHPEDLGWALQSFEREIVENPEIKFIVVRIRKKNGDWLWCMARGHNMLDNPNINAVVIYIHDDTPRKMATEALLESEQRFRSLIRDLQIGVLLQGADGTIEMTNNATCRMFDVSEEVFLGGRIWELYTDVTHEDGRRFLQEERPSYKALQTRQLVKDVVMGVWHPKRQERIWIMINADPILDEAGNVVRVVCSFTNITERKKLERKSFAEKMAHQRQLAQATIDGQEQERLEIGKELHDNIGQQLTTIKLFLDLAKSTADETTQVMLNRSLRNVTELINEVRSMSRSLVPPTLKDLGFIDSVNDLIESLRCTAVAVELDYYDFDEDKIPDNQKLALYRIIQEQLNNIIKHARAKQVSIILRLTAHNVLLQIKDDGVGFEFEKVKRGLGISNIYNRAELFGGKALFTASPGNGCEVNVSLPHTASVATL
ncbi:PAS domain S-box protein [Flavisolibacter sp. BT320]|nr:PAS domain S-box protein [Flavisolibacter longurius]